jgi:hypothetical protein
VAAQLVAVGVTGDQPLRPSASIVRAKAATTAQLRQAEARAVKLAEVDEQVANGRLVIRKMTALERARWAKRRKLVAANSTETERASRASILETRRRQAARLQA